MRVTTAMIFNSGTSGMQARQSELYKLQNQLSTGRRILSPEDDPIGASEALQVTQSKSVNKQFLDNQSNAQSQLGFLESTLGNITDGLLRISELAAGALNPSQGGMVVAELKGRLTSLIDLANTQDGTGQYIFAGYKSTTKPFQAVAQGASPPTYSLVQTYVNYMGDAGNPSLQVTASSDMAVSENGLDVFMQVKDASGNVTGKSLFDTMQNMINILDGTSTFSAVALTTARGEISSAVSHISTVRASVGARQNSLDTLTAGGGDVDYLYDARLSELQNLDFTAAVSQYTNIKMQLEAAQLTFKQTSQLSLFNIL
jgi:flagellar hook-associated protein 3 FlgL